jgi:hypothetical protein
LIDWRRTETEVRGPRNIARGKEEAEIRELIWDKWEEETRMIKRARKTRT